MDIDKNKSVKQIQDEKMGFGFTILDLRVLNDECRI